jgi:hypothetical protein
MSAVVIEGAAAAAAVAGRGRVMELSTYWYYRRPEPGFWDALEESPSLFLHALLEGLTGHVVDMLEHGFGCREEARAALESGCGKRGARALCVELLEDSGNGVMLDNYDTLRRLVVRMDAMEIERLLGRAAT